jgi:hypothetical protein
MTPEPGATSSGRAYSSEDERLKHEYVSGPRLPWICDNCGQQRGWRSPKQIVVWWSHDCPSRPRPDHPEPGPGGAR